jgi:hypothetical protein
VNPEQRYAELIEAAEKDEDAAALAEALGDTAAADMLRGQAREYRAQADTVGGAA